MDGESVMTLSEFTNTLKTEINKFNIYWRLKNSKDPEAFPMELSDDNSGLWWEMFTDFIERNKE